MFDTLSGKLQRIFKNLRGEGKLTAANMEEALREIRVALLEAETIHRAGQGESSWRRSAHRTVTRSAGR
jgi:signal recognition particle subunit SRP54